MCRHSHWCNRHSRLWNQRHCYHYLQIFLHLHGQHVQSDRPRHMMQGCSLWWMGLKFVSAQQRLELGGMYKCFISPETIGLNSNMNI
jgi:hypothetical protein